MIPFNKPTFDSRELEYMAIAIGQGHAAGNGFFTKQAEELLSVFHSGSRSLLMTSCTHALEASARLLDLQPGDEVIVPSFTFVSTASAFMWNGAKPVFADVRLDTLNIDPVSAEELITPRTKAICIVHYAGVAAEPDVFLGMANQHGLELLEDNAHGLGASYHGRPLGTFGAMSTLSFHETKNITCGEGGALIINDPSVIERAEILREKGTDRSRFLRGQVDKYTWVDAGSSWLMSDLLAAILVGQLERFEAIHARRMLIWSRYMEELSPWAHETGVALPTVPPGAMHTGHMFFLRLPSAQSREAFIRHMRGSDILSVFHYQSLHSSPQGMKLGGALAACPNSDIASSTVVRLPMFVSLTDSDQARVIEAATRFQPVHE